MSIHITLIYFSLFKKREKENSLHYFRRKVFFLEVYPISSSCDFKISCKLDEHTHAYTYTYVCVYTIFIHIYILSETDDFYFSYCSFFLLIIFLIIETRRLHMHITILLSSYRSYFKNDTKNEVP